MSLNMRPTLWPSTIVSTPTSPVLITDLNRGDEDAKPKGVIVYDHGYSSENTVNVFVRFLDFLS